MKQFEKSLTPPVLFVVFNRIETVKRTFEAIRKAAPSQLFVAADGPRDFVPQEQEKCQQVRDYIQNNIDWDCEVKTRFLEKNLGCRKAVSSAVDWLKELTALRKRNNSRVYSRLVWYTAKALM